MSKRLMQILSLFFGKTQVFWYAGSIFLLMAFAEVRQNKQYCSKVDIILENHVDNHFIDENDIVSEVLLGENNLGLYKKHDSISLKAIEQKLLANPYIDKAEVSRNLSGNLKIKAILKRPVMRLVRPGSPGYYLTEKGERMPLSNKFTARVLTIDGVGASQIGLSWHGEPTQNDTAVKALELLNKLVNNEDWKAMFTHVYINKRIELTLYPLLGADEIEFGSPIDSDEKFKYLRWYYKKIIPHRGLDSYKRVSLKFKNQIICQKRT